ncbi:MAG TPA: DsbA family protein [Candidatus Binatia bacterium]|nr:DsbA family protein [Candidatus Binatia bacterium]
MRRTAVLAAVAAAMLAGLALAADNDQLIKYYRKKANVPPAAKVAVMGLQDSKIKGVKEGTLEIGEGPAARKVPFVVSADGRYAVFGGIEDVTSDPAKAVMEKISLKGEPFKGPANAKVTIVEYSDFQCPFCSRGYQTMENQVLKDYGDKVRFFYKNYPLPFHPWAESAAVAAECAKEQKPEAFWKLYNGFFQNQGQINPQNVKDKATEFLKDSGVDMAKWDDCFDNKKSLPKVKAEMAEGSSVGVTGTPGFIINGRLVSGAQPYENFKSIIDDELASAKK